MSREFRKIDRLFASLMKQDVRPFPGPGQALKASPRQGVYVILGRKGRAAHVGRTLRGRKVIAQRLKDHLHDRSSFTINHLDSQGKKLRGEFGFRYIEVANPRARALLEHYAIGRLCPKCLGLGATG